VNYVVEGTHSRHLLDVYIPSGIDKPAKTVVYIHGGGWRKNSKKAAMRVCAELYKAGYVIVAADYRLSPDSVFPAQIYDCKTAIRFAKQNAAKYFIDTCNIGVVGHSAGGHLAALTGTSQGEKGLEGLHLGSTCASSDVQAVVDLYGPADLLNIEDSAQTPDVGQLKFGRLDTVITQLLGCHRTICPDKALKASPITYVNGNEPPFLILHGKEDLTVPAWQSQILHNKLVYHNQDSELKIVPNAGHGAFKDHAGQKLILDYFNSKLTN
jgi:acetyl esterase/lipase